MALIDNLEAARRLSRAIVSDVAIYNKEKVEEGIKNDNLFEVLADELEEGRQHYLSRIDPEITRDYNLYDIAIVDVLIKQSGKINSDIW